jgi:hypothetical protein
VATADMNRGSGFVQPRFVQRRGAVASEASEGARRFMIGSPWVALCMFWMGLGMGLGGLGALFVMRVNHAAGLHHMVHRS